MRYQKKIPFFNTKSGSKIVLLCNLTIRCLFKSIGVGNFDSDLIEQLLAFCNIKPVCNLVECNYLIQQPELLDSVRENNLVLMTVRALRTYFQWTACPWKRCLIFRALISADIVHKENIPDIIKDIAAINKKNEKHVMTRFLCQRGIQGKKSTHSSSIHP